MTSHDEAAKHLRVADKAIDAGDLPGADADLSKAIEIIGDQYYSPTAIDDTGQALTLAEIEREHGNMKRSVTIKRNVVQSRLNLLSGKFGLTKP